MIFGANRSEGLLAASRSDPLQRRSPWEVVAMREVGTATGTATGTAIVAAVAKTILVDAAEVAAKTVTVPPPLAAGRPPDYHLPCPTLRGAIGEAETAVGTVGTVEVEALSCKATR